MSAHIAPPTTFPLWNHPPGDGWHAWSCDPPPLGIALELWEFGDDTPRIVVLRDRGCGQRVQRWWRR